VTGLGQTKTEQLTNYRVELKGRGGGLVVSALAYCYGDLSLYPADNKIFTLWQEKTKLNKNEAGVGPFLKKKLNN